MSLGYLLSSLPMLSREQMPTLSAEAFLSACAAQLSAGDFSAVEALLSGRGLKDSRHPFCRAWCDAEGILANAVAKRRLAARSIVAGQGTFEPNAVAGCQVWIERAVDAAFDAGRDPLAREDALDGVRWAIAEELQGCDPMGKGMIFAYAVKLRMLLRKAARSQEVGRERLEAALPQMKL